MHCKAFGHMENFDMHSLKQVYIDVMSVALYGLNWVKNLVWILNFQENLDFSVFKAYPEKLISKFKHILGLSLKAKV